MGEHEKKGLAEELGKKGVADERGPEVEGHMLKGLADDDDAERYGKKGRTGGDEPDSAS
ncbi:MAG TPA: hypothetical protein VLA98_02535 [Solirubrobacteraceae bacterium]|nr:hypothetical protein [Solirubrobacteraceae bacterium]